jgi:hypothetical protein
MSVAKERLFPLSERISGELWVPDAERMVGREL